MIRGDDAAYADAARKRARLVDLLKSLEGRARAVLALGTAACTRAEAVCSGNAARDAMDFVQRYMFSMRMMPRATAQAQALEVVTVDAEQVVSRREVYALEAQYAQVEGILFSLFFLIWSCVSLSISLPLLHHYFVNEYRICAGSDLISAAGRGGHASR